MTEGVKEMVEGIVNSQGVRNSLLSNARNAQGRSLMSGGPDRTRTCDQSIMSRRL
jgi:hypothetical protein